MMESATWRWPGVVDDDKGHGCQAETEYTQRDC